MLELEFFDADGTRWIVRENQDDEQEAGRQRSLDERLCRIRELRILDLPSRLSAEASTKTRFEATEALREFLRVLASEECVQLEEPQLTLYGIPIFRRDLSPESALDIRDTLQDRMQKLYR